MSVQEKAAALLESNGIADPKAGAASAPDARAGAPRTGRGSGSDSAPAGESVPDVSGDSAALDARSPEGATNEDPDAVAHRELVSEKLRHVREKNQASKLSARARRDREQAAQDRQAAAADRDRWAKLGKGENILETLTAAGHDPKAVFQAMKDEALRAGTPEALVASVEAKFQKELAASVAPLKETIDQLTRDRDELAARNVTERFQGDFARVIAGDEFGDLRDEYGDARLLSLADQLRGDTDNAIALATRLGVRLTAPDRGLTMRELLSVLKAAQEEHDRQKTTRRTARTATTERTPAQTGSDKRQVNGTSERRNAGPTTIGNDLTTSTATGGKPKVNGASPAARLRERARRLYDG